MGRLARRHWPLVAALGLLWLAVAGVAVKSTRQNDAKLIYALDDAWIHMAIAKNVAEHGVFGVTRHGFTASSSSLLWTLLLSGLYAAFGVGQMLPLLLNVAFATLVVVLVQAGDGAEVEHSLRVQATGPGPERASLISASQDSLHIAVRHKPLMVQPDH